MLKFGKTIAHRGIFNNIDIPENSLLAFQKAITLNIPIELDIQLTKDNIIVVFHDKNLYRMTGINKNINKCTYQELKQYKLLNTNECIPTLTEVLKLVNHKILMIIEIKSTNRIKTICNLFFKEMKNYTNKEYIIQSFNPLIVRYLNKKHPNYITGYLISNKYPNTIEKYLLSKKAIISYSKAQFLSINKKLLPKKQFQKYLYSIPILVWTIKNKNEMKYKDIIYICNNLPYSK